MRGRPKYSNPMKTVLDPSDYPKAWAEYQRRWRAAWIIPLLLLALSLATAFPKGNPSPWLFIVTVVAYGVFYIRFVSWPCPRCGRQYTRSTRTGIFRSKEYPYCR